MILAMASAFLRSFFLQTLWNFERLQNIGFAFSMVPLLQKLDGSRAGLQRLIRRQLDFFNIHPYFAPLVMGVVFAQEKAKPSEGHENSTVSILKDSMGGAFGAVGDHVIWGTYRPFCAVAALGTGAFIAHARHDWRLCALWWIGGFLVAFNTLHLWLRARGLQKAIAEGPGVVRWVESLHLQKWAALIRRLGLLLLAVMTLAYLAHWARSPMLLWMVAVLLGSMVLKRWALSGVVLFYTVCAVSVAMVFLGMR